MPPPWTEVEAALIAWLASLPSIGGATYPVESIAAAHGAFERIHPFLDGNGRSGRLLMNLLLVRFGYPPAVIFSRDRNRYLRALWKADLGDPAPLGELVARSVTDNLHRFVIPAVAGPLHPVTLTALASQDLTVFALRAAIERGRLRAQKGPDGQWRSTRAWVDDYLASRYRREQ